MKKKKTKKRAYNNESRQEKVQNVSKHIVQTLIKLLAQQKGGEVPFKDLAKKSKVPLRTIFRLFKDKDALHAATERYLNDLLQTSMNKLERVRFIDFSKSTFSLYDEHENLVMAYLFSPFGQHTRNIFRKALNKQLTDQILQERKKIQLTEATKPKLALIVSLVNAKLWYDIRTDFGYSGAQIGETIGWALEVLLKTLEEENR